MPNRSDRLLSASFKGVSFLVRSESIDSFGQKWVQHDYPKSSSRYMEAQGQKSLDISIEIFFDGPNWQSDFQGFQRVANNPSPGRLTIPTFGVFENVVAIDPSAKAGQTTVGEITVSVRFTQTIERPSPTSVLVVAQDVAAQAADVREALRVVFQKDYTVPTTENNTRTAVSDFQQVAKEVGKITNLVKETQKFIKDINGKIKDAVAIANLLLSTDSPLGFLEQVAGTVDGLEPFGKVFNMVRVASDLTNSMNDILALIQPEKATTIPAEPGIDALSDVPVWPDDTSERRDRNQSRLAVANTFRVFGMVEMLESAALREYTTTDQIDEISNAINSEYTALIDNDETGVIIPGVTNALDILRGLTIDTLKNKRQNAYGIVEIKLEKEMPDTLLAYELYGERIRNDDDLTFLAELISGLNVHQPRHRLSGTVRVVEIG